MSYRRLSSSGLSLAAPAMVLLYLGSNDEMHDYATLLDRKTLQPCEDAAG